MDSLKQDARLQVFDLPVFDGITLVRKAGTPEGEVRK
jgi:hypothetical protein